MRKIVEKKILPEYFNAVINGEKTFEIRKDEDNLQKGDALILREWDGEKYTMEIKEAKDILELIRDNIETPIPEITRTGLAITALTGGIDAIGHVEMMKKRFMDGMSVHFTQNDDIECPFCGYKVVINDDREEILPKHCLKCGTRLIYQ